MLHHNEDLSTDASGPMSLEHLKVLYKGIHVGLAEPFLRQESSRVSCKSSPPPTLRTIRPQYATVTSILVWDPRNVASGSSHILTGCFSAPTLATLRGFRTILNLITNPYYSLPSPPCAWQGLDTDISSWKIMHCQGGKRHAVIPNTCIRYFKAGNIASAWH